MSTAHADFVSDRLEALRLGLQTVKGKMGHGRNSKQVGVFARHSWQIHALIVEAELLSCFVYGRVKKFSAGEGTL